MGNYLPSTSGQQKEMLSAIGLSALEELYGVVPKDLMLKCLDLPKGKSEMEVLDTLGKMAAKNTVFPTVFRGAGAYKHFIPSVVSAVASKETFVTAYTPYQAEISQGILQSIFEYQTMICQLTGMAVSNASVYDGASAAAEAVAMCKERKRSTALISAAAHPDVIDTIKTYCWGSGMALRMIPEKDGATDLAALKEMLGDDVACVYAHQLSFYGIIEDCTAIAQAAHAAGAKMVMGVNPIAAAILKTAADCGADVAVGEGQPLGMPLSFGGPYLGFMAATDAMTRRLPGRIVGETKDDEGRRAFVLTLQAREQHIRREKASSNICSNQALCATTAAVYLAAMGPCGLADVAQQCVAKAHYMAQKLEEAGCKRRHSGEFFCEFVTDCKNAQTLLQKLQDNGVLGGLPVEGGILWCATEMNTKAEIDALAKTVKEVCG